MAEGEKQFNPAHQENSDIRQAKEIGSEESTFKETPPSQTGGVNTPESTKEDEGGVKSGKGKQALSLRVGEAVSHLISKKKIYEDIVLEGVPEGIRELIEKKRAGKILKGGEASRFNKFMSQLVVGESEPIELSVYPEEVQQLVRKARSEGLTDEENVRLWRLVTAVLEKKDFVEQKSYLESALENNKSSGVLSDFYHEILKRGEWDNDSINSLKGYLISKHPKDVEEIQVIANSVQYFAHQVQLDKERKAENYKYDPEVSKNFAEYNYLLSHFLSNQTAGRKYAQNFWEVVKFSAHHLGFDSEFDKLRTGILGQVALYKALKSLGQDPKFSTPNEDVYYKVDLWSTNSLEELGAFQLKTSKEIRRGMILKESDWLRAYPNRPHCAAVI